MSIVTAWRLVGAEHGSDAFNGNGSQRTGERYNSEGIAVVYAADSLALAVLEVAVNLPSYSDFTTHLAFRISFPEDLIERLVADELPEDWNCIPPSESTRRLGDAWVREARSAVLCVPSVVVSYHCNFVLNPRHPDFSRIRVDEPQDVSLDPRLSNDD